jgi:hypothetical protein
MSDKAKSDEQATNNNEPATDPRNTPASPRKRHPAVRKNAPTKTRADTVIALLKRRRGATVGQLMDATGWQAHSVRGFLSRTLRRRMGLTVTSKKAANGERRYHIDGSKV